VRGVGLHLPAALVVAKKEGAIVQNGPASSAAKLVAVKGAGIGAGLVKKHAGIEGGVAHKLEGLAVQMIASGLADDTDYACIIGTF
jgi:hypothetical protein